MVQAIRLHYGVAFSRFSTAALMLVTPVRIDGWITGKYSSECMPGSGGPPFFAASYFAGSAVPRK